MKIKKSSTSLATLLSCLLLTSPAFASGFKMSEDNLTLSMTGASAHVERFNGVDRVWRSDGAAGTVASDCNDAGVCTSVSLTGRLGYDFTVVTFPNGNKRAYFKDMDPSSQQVYSAPCLDAGCTSIGSRSVTSEEMKVPSSQKAWGVPDAVLLPDNRVRIYIVESPVVGRCLEKIASYISTDGITFTKEPGWRLEGGYVDTEIIRAKAGDYLMILADIRCTSSNRQQLFATASKDGLSWSSPQLLTGAGVEGLDPTGYEVSPDVFRIYYSYSPATKGAENYQIKRGTLTYTATQAQTPPKEVSEKVSTGKKSITCVKGKSIKKINGINPKCPTGFKKR